MTLDELREYAFRHHLPLDVNIELTQKCNFRCPHCYCPENKHALSTEQAKDIVLKCQRVGVVFINFTGGEVTTRKDFPEIYRYARELGSLVSIQTNLSHLSVAMKSALIAHKPRHVSVTLYGTSNEEYQAFAGLKNGYSRVLENLDFLQEAGIRFALKAVLTRQTRDSAMAGRYAKVAQRYGKTISWDGIIFGRKDGDLSSLSHRMTPVEIVDFDRMDQSGCRFWDRQVAERSGQDQIRCGGGISSFSVDSLGRASICSLYVSEKFDFLKTEFDEVWKKLKASHDHMQMHYQRSSCSRCTNKSLCRWCAAYAVLEHGNPERPVMFMCALASERVSRASPSVDAEPRNCSA